jgi:hypothetical protein
MSHRHKWEPVQGRRGRYTCACGQRGYRGAAGVLVARDKRAKYTAIAPMPYDAVPRETSSGWVGRAPSLDETERRSR